MWGAGVAESGDRLVWPLPGRPGSAGPPSQPAASSQPAAGEPARGARTAPGAQARPERSAAPRRPRPTPLPAPLPSAPRTASPAPPHPAPSSLHERKWESQTPGTSGNKTQRRPRGGRGEGEGKSPGTRPAARGHRAPRRPRRAAALTSSGIRPRGLPLHPASAALQSRLGTAAARAPRAATLRVKPRRARHSLSEEAPGPFPRNRR